MIFNLSRLEREKLTVSKMIDLYCKIKHNNLNNCSECEEIKKYALLKLSKCPYQNEKPTCINCPIHCYQAKQKEKIREIMRFSGPKMIFYHPILAIYHIIDNKAKKQIEKNLIKKQNI